MQPESPIFSRELRRTSTGSALTDTDSDDSSSSHLSQHSSPTLSPSISPPTHKTIRRSGRNTARATNRNASIKPNTLPKDAFRADGKFALICGDGITEDLSLDTLPVNFFLSASYLGTDDLKGQETESCDTKSDICGTPEEISRQNSAEKLLSPTMKASKLKNSHEPTTSRRLSSETPAKEPPNDEDPNKENLNEESPNKENTNKEKGCGKEKGRKKRTKSKSDKRSQKQIVDQNSSNPSKVTQKENPPTENPNTEIDSTIANFNEPDTETNITYTSENNIKTATFMKIIEKLTSMNTLIGNSHCFHSVDPF